VGMDKAFMKLAFTARGLPVAEYRVLRAAEWRTDRDRLTEATQSTLGFPVFVKPANLGSSVGISKVHNASELPAAMTLATEFDRKIIVERAVPEAREIECAVLGNETAEASVPGEIVPSREFYDYQAKYIDGHSRLEIPAQLDDELTREVKRLALVAFDVIDGSGLARVDFLLSRATGALYLNEINTLPGFTTISMYSKLWAASGVPYATLVDRLIALAIERHTEKQELKTHVF
jgi:D-alanine-D-alanine ligase